MKNRIRTLRKERGFSQDDLARIIGTTQPQIARMESGERALKDYWIERLAAVFHCHPGEIFAPLPNGQKLTNCQQKAIEYCDRLSREKRDIWLNVAEGFVQGERRKSR